MPPQTGEFSDDTKGLLFDKFPEVGSWLLDSSFSKIAGNNKFAVNPSAGASGVAVSIAYLLSNGIKVQLKTTRALGLDEFSLNYEKEGHSFTVEPKDGVVRHSWRDATFATNIQTEVLDGLASEGGVSCNIAESVVAGVKFAFDPYRSGLRDYTLLARFTQPKYLKSGSRLVLGYGGFSGISASIAVPFCSEASFVASFDKGDGLIAGSAMKFHNGVVAAVYTNLRDRLLAVSAAQSLGSWTVAATAQVDLLNVAAAPKFGVKFSSS